MIDASEDREVLLNRLAEEFAARQRVGERPSLHEYCQRHPELTEEIRSLFPALVELERVKADAGSELAVAAAPTITILGDFRLLREVGRGGMGVVYEAEQISLGRRVALKLLPATVLSDPNRRLRFEREAKAAAKLHHTNIVPVHGFGEHDGTPYYVMQFIPGLGLDAVIEELRRLPTDGRSGVSHQLLTGQKAAMSVALARSLVGADKDRTAAWNPADDNAHATTACGGTTPDIASLPKLDSVSSVSLTSSAAQLPGQSGSGIGALAKKKFTYWESVAQIGVQVGGALAYAHKQGVLHRDIKPANLLLDLDGIVWVTDFGLAKADDSDNLTQTGDILGTWRYMSPEAFEGKSDVRSDIYSLGLTLYELLALRPAFDDKERKKLIKQVTTGEPTPLDRLRREVPRDLVTIVHKSIAKEPARRYSLAEEMASDLQRFIDDEPILARRQTQLERYVRWARHNPGIAVLGAVLTAVLVLATFASLIVAGHMSNLARNEAQAAEDERIIRRQAVELRKRADTAAEVAQQNLYYAQMHLGQHAWREHRGLPQLHELLTNWLPKQELPDRRGWEWFYLNSLPYQNIRALAKSDDSGNLPCCIVAWHAASKRLATGTSDGLIRIWDIGREQTTLVLKGPGPAGSTHWEAKWFAWSPDGRKLAAGFRDGTFHLWETGSGREISVFRGHTSPVMSAAYSSDGLRLAAWGENGAIKVWESDTGQLIADVAHSGAITTGAWSPDDKLLAAGHEDGTVTISGTQAGDKIITLRGHLSQIHALAWHPDGTRLASTSFDFTARIWDVALEKTVVGPLRHSHEITSAAWEQNGKRLATGSIDETVKIWNATTGHEDLTLRGHVSPVTSLAWILDGRLASGGHDGSVKIWTSISDQESSVLPGHVVRATSVSWSPNGKLLASGGDDGKVRIWDAATHEEIRAIKAHDESRISQQFGLILSLSWSPNGARLASGSLDGTAKVFEVASGREVFVLPNNRGSVWSVAWSPDGNRLAVGSQDGTIRMIEEINETPKVQVINAHQSRVRGLAWSPQGDRLASAGADKLVKVWDPIRGAELAHMQGHQFAVFRTAWSPDGKRLASCGADFRLVMTWDAQTGQRLATMRGHNDWAEAVVWSPDGTRLASAGNDNSVRIWDPRSGEETLQLRGTAGFFHDVSWHPDGEKLAAASSDGQIWVWDATPGFEHDKAPRTLLKEENRNSHDKPDQGSAQ